MKAGKIKSLITSIFGCFYAVVAHSATSLFSDYGQIQNVQYYSTNPFWSPDSPYNQKMPQPIYVQGNNVSTEECIDIVKYVVATQCASHNNCINTTLADIRPGAIIQLSNMSGKPYSTACVGYLDTIYESYVQEYGNYAPKYTVSAPAITNTHASNTARSAQTMAVKNPFSGTTPKWQQEINERTAELQRLQKQTNSVNNYVVQTSAPKTFEDLSFTQQVSVKKEDYKKYPNSAYVIPNFLDDSQWCTRGANKNTPECLQYRCNAISGTERTTKDCIAWRCSDTQYANANPADCEEFLCLNTPLGKENFNKCKQYTCKISKIKTLDDACKEYLCGNQGAYHSNAVCREYLCTKPAYKKQHADLCTQQSTSSFVDYRSGQQIPATPVTPVKPDTNYSFNSCLDYPTALIKWLNNVVAKKDTPDNCPKTDKMNLCDNNDLLGQYSASNKEAWAAQAKNACEELTKDPKGGNKDQGGASTKADICPGTEYTNQAITSLFKDIEFDSADTAKKMITMVVQYCSDTSVDQLKTYRDPRNNRTLYYLGTSTVEYNTGFFASKNESVFDALCRIAAGAGSTTKTTSGKYYICIPAKDTTLTPKQKVAIKELFEEETKIKLSCASGGSNQETLSCTVEKNK